MLLGDKKLRDSATMVGAGIVGFIEAAARLGYVPEGAPMLVAQLGQVLAGLYVVFGFRRAVGQNGLRAPFEPEEITVEAQTIGPDEG